ncbi:hypothetical protein M8J75_007612 [Diaphorina citri]|nr:hypothetical protein M8J75_007612 [Diaphorina citri]
MGTCYEPPTESVAGCIPQAFSPSEYLPLRSDTEVERNEWSQGKHNRFHYSKYTGSSRRKKQSPNHPT